MFELIDLKVFKLILLNTKQMNNSFNTKRYLLIFILLIHSIAFLAQTSETNKPEKAFSSEEVVDKLYELVTFKAGTTPDWEKVKSLFIDDAVIVLRTSWEETSILSVDDFVADFVEFIEGRNVIETGFSETIIKKESMIFGDIATFLVLYEAYIPGSERPPQKGVDSFSLIKKNGEWKIISILNEIPTEKNPIPDSLKD